MLRKYYERYCNSSEKIKAAVWYTICNFFQKGISVLVVPIYTRLLTTEQYGSYVIWVSWLEIFEILATFRLSWGNYIAGLVKFEEDRDRFTSAMQSLGFTITSICFAVYLVFADFINSLTGLSAEMTIMIFVILYTMPSISFWSARQRVEYRYKNVVKVTLLCSILIPVVGIYLVKLCEPREFGLAGGRAVVQGIVGLVLMYVSCSRNFTFFHKTYWRRALSFNISLIPYYLSLVVLQSSNRIIIEKLVGKSAAGIFAVAFSASMVMLLFNSALNSTIQPWLYSKIKNSETKGVSDIVSGTLVLVAALNLLLTAFAPEAVMLLAPPAYYEAIYIMPPIIASVVIMFCYQNFVITEFYFEKGQFISLASIIAALANIGLNFWLIPVYGYYAAGYVTLFCYTVFGVAHYFFMNYVLKQRQIDLKIINVRQVGTIFLIYGILAVITAALYDNWLVRYAMISVLALGIALKRKKIIGLYSAIKKDR